VAADSETQYETGRRVEEIVAVPGAISKMAVTTVMLAPIDSIALERLRTVVANAAGSRAERGDTVVVFSAEQMAARQTDPVSPAENAKAVAEFAGEAAPASAAAFDWTPRLAIAFLLAAGGVLLLVLLLMTQRRPQRVKLDAQQRDAMLVQLRGWLESAKTDDQERS
jgi:flagellar M-ring protein FliF